MTNPSKCLVCGAPLPVNAAGEYHDDCAKSIFGSTGAPLFDCDEHKLNELARKLVLNRMSVPGVQAKLSVHLERRDGADRLTLVGMGGDWILKLPAVQWPEPSCCPRRIIPRRGSKNRSGGVTFRPFQIPLRSCIAKDADNLFMAGRCISGDFYAQASYRVTGSAVALGEAVGKAAAGRCS